METQTWLSCHNKFIPAENITIFPVSSDDFLHAILEVADILYKNNTYPLSSDTDWILEKKKLYIYIYIYIHTRIIK